eukprot:gene8190-9068_t
MLKQHAVTAQSHAIIKGHVRGVKISLKVGMNPNKRDRFNRTPLIMLSLLSDEQKAITIAKHLVKHGAKIELADDRGMNALHYACQRGKHVLVEYLLSHYDDYDVFARNGAGKTALHYANESGWDSIVNMMRSIADKHGINTSMIARANSAARKLSIKAGENKPCGFHTQRIPLFENIPRGLTPRGEKCSIEGLKRYASKCGESEKVNATTAVRYNWIEQLREDDTDDHRKTHKGNEKRKITKQNSKEMLVEIYKLFGQQASPTYRKSARKPPPIVEITRLTPSPLGSVKSTLLFPSARRNRSKSVCPAMMPKVNFLGSGKRRPSRASLQQLKALSPDDNNNNNSMLSAMRWRRRGSTIPFESNPGTDSSSCGTGDKMRDTGYNQERLSSSAPNIPVIREYNTRRVSLMTNDLRLNINVSSSFSGDENNDESKNNPARFRLNLPAGSH